MKILVAGDFVIDHHIYEGRRHHFGDAPDSGVAVCSELGGAALIHRILNAINGGPPISSLAIADPFEEGALPKPALDAHAFWRPYPAGVSRDKQRWRVSEAMGFGSIPARHAAGEWAPNPKRFRSPGVIVLSEGGMGFRDDEAAWKELPFSKARHIVFKMSAPVARGGVWDYLTGNPAYAKKLVLVLSAGDLRKMHAQLSEGRSWEDTLENLSCELSRDDGALAPLTRCRHLVVAFSTEAGVWCDFPAARGAKPRMHFVYDPARAENEMAQNTEGAVFGMLSCLTAAVAWNLSSSSGPKPDLSAAIESGLAAMRNLREEGHGIVTTKARGYPAERLAGLVKHGGDPSLARLCLGSFDACQNCGYPVCARADKKSSPHRWSLLRQVQDDKAQPCYGLARRVLEYGAIALQRMPHLRIGKLFSADRAEIETLRSLREIIRRYVKHDSGKKPLSIGVFGPPGAGKSFSVKQLAGNLVGDRAWLEFNLSQFSHPDDLTGAFHQIRDLRLQDITPVAFFDEFDANQYQWLQYLLAPMQDGRFQEGQITHALGKCIFILAGGTSRSFETFGPAQPHGKPDTPAYRQQELACQAFVRAKGPDFRSRLDAYLNVTGPNRRDRVLEQGRTGPQNMLTLNGWRFIPDEDDLCFPVRRALIIRSELGCEPDARLDMDEGLARALLQVSHYENGSRSLSKILGPYKAVRNGHLGVSLLPARAILEMHTSADEFLGYCLDTGADRATSTLALSPEAIDSIGPAIHDTYRELGRREGWLNPELDVPLADVKDSFKRDSNYAAARRMPGILALVGLRLARGKASAAQEADVRQRLELSLDLLAMKEHEGWMAWHLENGWQYAPVRNDGKRLHNCLVPFPKLGESDRNKDREQIRHYPEFARAAGLKIVPDSGA